MNTPSSTTDRRTTPPTPPVRRSPSPVAKWLTIIFMVLAGLYLVIGGVWLIAVGGSPYYVVAGIVMLAIARLVLRKSALALWLYALLLICTLIWAVAGRASTFGH